MLALMTACESSGKLSEKTQSGLLTEKFDSVINGKKTALYILKNNSGMEVCITNYGGRVVSVIVPDKKGRPTDVVLG